MFDEPIYDVDFFQTEVADPMDYFMATGFDDIGIDTDALLFEGEAWNIKEESFKPGIDETGCYLCLPGRVGPVIP